MKRNPVVLKSNQFGLTLNLDPDMPFDELLASVGEKFKASAAFFKNAAVAVTFHGRELSFSQESDLVDVITGNSSLRVVCIIDDDPEHKEQCKTAVSLALEKQQKEQACFYRGTLHNGEHIESETGVVVIGDVNPGARITTRGSVLVFGCCMGSIKAGSSGNTDCFVAALTLKCNSVQIADKYYRSGFTKREDPGDYPIEPMIAYIQGENIIFEHISKDELSEAAGQTSPADQEGEGQGDSSNAETV